jgi:mannobiose 2-epimerase
MQEGTQLVEALLKARPEIERILTENILPFWHPGCIDTEYGGYSLGPGGANAWEKPCRKFLIPHARVCWFFSRMAREGRLAEGISAAEHGFRFLRDCFWDRDEGGFFWEVTPDGQDPLDDGKRLYAEAFGLFAASEFARASNDPEAISLALESARILEDRYRDRVCGGYLREFSRDWTAVDPARPAAGKARLKSTNDHLHVLEALIALSSLPGQEGTHSRLQELVLILSNTVVRLDFGACTDWHRKDWTPLLGKGYRGVSYGHDLESFWLVREACRVVGLPDELILDWGGGLLDHCLRWGWDRTKGGVYFAGPLGGPAHSREKVWWVQAEALVAALLAYRLTGYPRYAEFFLRTLEWVTTRQVDWNGGGWYEKVQPNGRITRTKADHWKTPYHNGRAMMICSRLLGPGEAAGIGEL